MTADRAADLAHAVLAQGISNQPEQPSGARRELASGLELLGMRSVVGSAYAQSEQNLQSIANLNC
jgi:hypothetical protein